MDFSNFTNNIQNYIISMLFLSAAIGSIISFIKQLLAKNNFTKTKTYQDLFLPLTPYIIGFVLFKVLKSCNQPIDIIQILLASSLSDTAYRIYKKTFEIYQAKQEKEELKSKEE